MFYTQSCQFGLGIESTPEPHSDGFCLRIKHSSPTALSDGRGLMTNELPRLARTQGVWKWKQSAIAVLPRVFSSAS